MTNYSQLNAISRYYTKKHQVETLREIERRGLLSEYEHSKYATPSQFLRFYKTPEQAAAAKEKAKEQAKKRAKERREICKKYGVKTLAEVESIKRLECLKALKKKIEEGLKSGEYRIAKTGNIISKKNRLVCEWFEWQACKDLKD